MQFFAANIYDLLTQTKMDLFCQAVIFIFNGINLAFLEQVVWPTHSTMQGLFLSPSNFFPIENYGIKDFFFREKNLNYFFTAKGKKTDQ